jgi:hypothetical protein
MSFILVSKNGEEVQVNGWNWRPTLELLLEAGLITEGQYARISASGVGGEISAETANAIAIFVESKLETMKLGDRMRANLTVTSEPKTRLIFKPDGSNKDEVDLVDTYSASYEWLVTFADFCRRSGGFEVS